MTLAPTTTYWIDTLYDLTFEWLECLIDSWIKRVSVSYGNYRIVLPRWLVLMTLIGLTMAFA